MRRVRPLTRSPGRPARRTSVGPRGRADTIRRSGMDRAVGLHEFIGLMGTTISIHLADDLDQDCLDYLCDQAFTWFRQIDRSFSTHRPDSEISRLRRGEIRLEECSPEVRAVVDQCGQLHSLTNGYFDAYASGKLDPSGFVRGWAVQVASDRLMLAGCVNHRINAGGDVRAHGHPGTDRLWRVGIHHPMNPVALRWTIAGTDLAVATSTVCEPCRHIINPREGRPSIGLRSVTVLGPDLGVASAFATAAVAMGLPALSWLASLPDHEAAVITDDGRCFQSAGLPTAT